MMQRFIELGRGYSDLYELLEIINRNKDRVRAFVQLDVEIGTAKKTSLAVVLDETSAGHFMPIYICLEGIPQPEETPNARFNLFKEQSEELGIPIKQLAVKPSTVFNEKELYYQYLIGILRLNRIIPPLS
ncbi:Methylthioribose kinase [Alkalihalobacillus alcalophilus ATCC 27647 = CGMCC 1.3604]|uniref:Methylthioribose kinase n=1 Tax=Alkalihalobacillus alcalophilus ATCC 27647 = CGMCC 1.3604 TaxID=1218173 RepID=A0A094WS10_ALKAL|nr:hypothetical protein [Alkalihalobacillus alcalophilus]KGA98823.1 methylthioribose kinase [Alkalihalobacillus alcalophilus ATCC 27647 = CGMCC 1.3604]MED1564299.1 methylthioribose kinase [Alkalihalobacillus alcalophilus]THG88895.1 Methylthioribose kinase [Alkalihalobacillus alcalophilus ATCC 27647 = CGMCC 1.3604]